MGDKPETIASRMELVAALVGYKKPNAENQPREQIKRVLESMLGCPIQSATGLMGLMSGCVIIPDFEDLPAHSSYGELSNKIVALREIQSRSRNTLSLLNKTDAGYEKAASEIDACFSVRPSAGLHFDNILRLNGVHASSKSTIAHLILGSRQARLRLEEEKRAYHPSGRGRRRNVHAYLVAERLARFYLTYRKEKPTYGTGEGGIPAGDYQRALEKIFQILEIEADTRGPAKAACKAIADDDLIAAKTQFMY